MTSLKIFRIEFNRPNAVYIPGEIVSGHVIINLAKEKTAKGLRLSAKGEANVKWDKQTSTTDCDGHFITTTATYRDNEKYFDLKISLLERLNDGEVHLPAGLSKYPFCIQLPYNIPSSFEHKIGHIRYTIKATIVKWRFKDHECKVAFTIITPYDLNIRREQCFGIHEEVNQVFSCCCFIGTSINAHIKIPMTGLVLGQWLEIFFDLQDVSIELDQICVKLQQSLEFRAKTSKKHVKEIVLAGQKLRPFDKHITIRLLVPSIPPSELEFCTIIHLKYILRIIFHNSEMYRKIVKEYPILIGTIPLRPVPSAPVASSSSHVSQSTSKT